MYTYNFMEKILFPPTILHKGKLINEIEGKTFLITGASSGIGRTLACELAEYRVTLILIARREQMLQQLKEELKECPAAIQLISADLRKEEDMQKTIEELVNLPIHFFISNAGLSINRPLYESLDRFHDFSRTMAINYFAPVQLLLALLPNLEKNNGQIVNVSTINTLLLPFPNWAAYQASKNAFDTWFRSSSPELNKKGMATSTLYLPLVKTPMIEPTIAYRNTPAMNSIHVAHIILKMLYTKRRTYKPWWAIFGQFVSFVFRGLIEKRLAKPKQKKEKSSHANKPI